MTTAKEIKVGQIWQVTTDNFTTSGDHNKYKRPLKLAKGEKIEIRHPYAWHFRTEDSHYFHADAEMILQNCKLFGEIFDKVRLQNRANFEEILRLRLYDVYDGN